MFIVQVNDNDGILQDLIHVGIDRAKADAAFLSVCAERFTNWSEYGAIDVQSLLEDGYAKFGGGIIMLIDTSNCVTDDELRDQLRKQPSRDTKVAKIVQEGELDLWIGMTVDRLIAACEANLEDIREQVLFMGSDGKWYTITTESIIGEATPEFVRDTLEEVRNGD